MIVAHLGHWYASLLYLGPLAAIVAFLIAQNRLERRRRDQRKDR
jgi:hypothetical protein